MNDTGESVGEMGVGGSGYLTGATARGLGRNGTYRRSSATGDGEREGSVEGSLERRVGLLRSEGLLERGGGGGIMSFGAWGGGVGRGVL